MQYLNRMGGWEVPGTPRLGLGVIGLSQTKSSIESGRVVHL